LSSFIIFYGAFSSSLKHKKKYSLHEIKKIGQDCVLRKMVRCWEW